MTSGANCVPVGRPGVAVDVGALMAAGCEARAGFFAFGVTADSIAAGRITTLRFGGNLAALLTDPSDDVRLVPINIFSTPARGGLIRRACLYAQVTRPGEVNSGVWRKVLRSSPRGAGFETDPAWLTQLRNQLA